MVMKARSAFEILISIIFCIICIGDDMKKMVFYVLAGFLLQATLCHAASSPLSIDANGHLMKDGKPFRAIGVNYYSVMSEAIAKPYSSNYLSGLKYLQDNNVPFIRVMMGTFWPADMKLYFSNKNRYFYSIDKVVAAAKRSNIGIVATISWNPALFPDLSGEPMSAVGNLHSNSHALMRQYIRDVVSRYKNSGIIWAWELSNEMNLKADLPNAHEFRPPISVVQGTPATRSELDDYTHDHLAALYEVFKSEVTSQIPDAILSTGNSLPRPYSWHNYHYDSWDSDNQEQFCEMLSMDNPPGYHLMSIHAYPNISTPDLIGFANYFARSEVPFDEILQVVTDCSKKTGQSVFLGEFGVKKMPYMETEMAVFKKTLDAIVASDVGLSALWVYRFAYQNTTFNVSNESYRKYQINAIGEANLKLQELAK